MDDDDLHQAANNPGFVAFLKIVLSDDPRMLGACMWRLYQRSAPPDLNILDEAIQATQRAVERDQDLEPSDRPQLYFDLGVRLDARSDLTHSLDDLDHSMLAFQAAVDLTSDDNSNQPERLNRLGASRAQYLERVGRIDDLNVAVTAFSRAFELLPDGHFGKPILSSNLGNALRTRSKHTGELDDVEQSVSSTRRAVELTPDGHPDKPSRFNSLGNSLYTRFKRTGELDDIEQAISSHHRAVELTPDGHPDKPSRFNNLGNSLQARFERTGELDDLEQAISSHRRAVELTPDGHPNMPSRFSNLGNSLHTRFERTGELDDIEQAVSSHRRAVELTPHVHPNMPSRFSNLGGSLWTRFQHTGVLDDIEQAVSSHRRAVELTPDGHPDKPSRINNLGNSLHTRFERTGELDDLEQAISSHRRAVELTPDGHPDKSLYLSNLGESIRGRHEHTPTGIDCMAAVGCYMEATMHTSGSPSARLDSALRSVRLLHQNPSISTPDSLLSAYSRIIAVLPEIVWLGYDIQRRYTESSRVGELINLAVFAAIYLDALTLAVEWLEAGRSLIWAQVLSLRTPLEDLKAFDPELAECLRRVQQGLRSSARSSFAPETRTVSDVPGLTTNRAADAHRALAIEHDDLLKKIRACPGFEDFLRPKSFDVLATSALKMLSGSMVFINVSVASNALVLHPNGELLSIPLPELSTERANKLRSLWATELRHYRDRIRDSAASQEELPLNEESPQLALSDVTLIRYMARAYEDGKNDATRVLEHLWEWIVHPITQSLNLTVEDHNHNGVLPHITWCPTGPLAQLPLHAAGIYSEPHGPRAFDFIVSSYTPSLSALLRCLEGGGRRDAPPSVLVVTQPATPKCSRLPGTREEKRCLQAVLRDAQIPSTVYDHDKATVKSVRDVMGQYPWVHLACHGSQHRTDPTKSAFELYDGPFTLSDLMGTVSDNAELAFLSACQTAVGDEKVPEESAHLAAGMLAVGFKGVVATMWSIGDADAPIVVEAYYKELIALREAGVLRKGETGVAYALHAATKVLREKVGEAAFMRWVPFVHFGV
ncbi:unnamed protein product [Peniophora sp. CBMAI 1063]|nr:unnamed protein product [Peniophora sp. CBMAI 1063]